MSKPICKLHISIDIETLGNTGRAPITQIGAVAFAADGEVEGEFNGAIDPEFYDNERVRSNFEYTASTLMWWMAQTRGAQQAAFSGTADLFTVLMGFRTWCWDCAGDRKMVVWAKPPQFDLVILRHAYRVMQKENPDFDGEPAWRYWEERCLRTLIETFPRIGRIERQGTHHDALADAYHQQRQIAEGLRLKRELYKPSGKGTS